MSDDETGLPSRGLRGVEITASCAWRTFQKPVMGFDANPIRRQSNSRPIPIISWAPSKSLAGGLTAPPRWAKRAWLLGIFRRRPEAIRGDQVRPLFLLGRCSLKKRAQIPAGGSRTDPARPRMPLDGCGPIAASGLVAAGPGRLREVGRLGNMLRPVFWPAALCDADRCRVTSRPSRIGSPSWKSR